MPKQFFLRNAMLLTLSCLLFACDKVKRSDSGSTGGGGQPPTNPAPDTVLSNGVNLQPSYYNNGNVNFAWDLMKQNARIKTLRLEIEPFVNLDQVKAWISAAVTNGYDLIATYHDYSVLGSDDAADLASAANWWKNNYATLRQAGSFTINLMNEWGSHNISASAYADAYNVAIGTVRQVYKGWIIIDCPGWGQETATAVAAIKGTAGSKINDSMVILSMHVYPNGWNQAHNHALQTADVDELATSNRPCIIGEFGSMPMGQADWAGIVEYAKTKKWAVLGWCWNGDGGIMNMMSPSWSDDATASTFSPSGYFATVYDHL